MKRPDIENLEKYCDYVEQGLLKKKIVDAIQRIEEDLALVYGLASKADAIDVENSGGKSGPFYCAKVEAEAYQVLMQSWEEQIRNIVS